MNATVTSLLSEEDVIVGVKCRLNDQEQEVMTSIFYIHKNVILNSLLQL